MASYPNRTDLQGGKPMAPTAAPGQGYGQAKQQIDSQKVVPIRAPGAPGADQAGAGAAPPAPAPMPTGAFGGPSERPGEPVTSGLAVGPGPGPEALGQGFTEKPRLADRLASLAEMSGSSDLKWLADKARELGQ